MKILIAGAGKVGATLARKLSFEGYDLILIDSNPRVLDAIVERFDVMAVEGNCATMPTLRDAGVESADLLIAATNADEINLLCCMTAHEMNPRLHTIARVRNPEYTDQIFSMRGLFALSMLVNPEKQAAIEIERLLKYPGFLRRDTFAKGRVEIVELRVDAASKLRDVSLSEMYTIVKCRVLVCTVLRDGAAVTPNGDFVLREGDRIFVTAPTANLTTLLKNLNIITRQVRRAILCGGGKLSYYLAELLQRDGIQVELIEQDAVRCLQLAALLPKVSVMQGDASNQDLLESEGLKRCDALVALTGLDELNMIIALYAHSCGVPQVVTKISRVENGHLVDSLPLGSVVCPKELCCDHIVRYVRAMQNQTGAAVSVHAIADGQAEAVEFLADDTTMHCGRPLRDISVRKDVLVVCITHGGKTELPTGASCFVPGDTIIIVTDGKNVIHQLNDIFDA